MTPASDKREYPRSERKVVLEVAPKDGGLGSVASHWTLVTSKNISAGGVLFTFDRVLDQGTALDFSIHFPEKTIRCAGIVHRTSPAAHQPLVNVAARLEGFRRGDREFIEQYPAA
jgi:hypothetical protein